MPDEDELEAQLEQHDEDDDLDEGTGEFLDIEDGDLTQSLVGPTGVAEEDEEGDDDAA